MQIHCKQNCMYKRNYTTIKKDVDDDEEEEAEETIA